MVHGEAGHASNHDEEFNQSDVFAAFKANPNWKLIEPGKAPRVFQQTNTETGQLPRPRLFNLDEDPGETRDLAEDQPEKVKELQALLQKINGEL
jgi:arylsulfatase A-like enzyme